MYFSYIWAGLVQTFGFEWYHKGALNVNTQKKKLNQSNKHLKNKKKKKKPSTLIFSHFNNDVFFPLRLIDWYIYKKVNISITLLYHLINLSHRLKSRDTVIVLFVFSKKSGKSSTHKYRLELKNRKILFQFLFCISFCCSNAEWHVEKLNITYSSRLFSSSSKVTIPKQI